MLKHWEYKEDREKFEKWVAERRKKKLLCPINMEYDPHHNYYLYPDAEVAWESWKAALASERLLDS